MLSVDESVLENYREWLIARARFYLPRSVEERKDLAQEGYIAMWRALQTFDPDKGALTSWVQWAADQRMRNVLRKWTWTGAPMAKGHHRENPATPVDTNADWVVERIGETSDLLDGILWQYHEGDIINAINELTPQQRAYVYRMFWRGETYTEIAKTLPAANQHWSKAKKALRVKLAHLVEV